MANVRIVSSSGPASFVYAPALGEAQIDRSLEGEVRTDSASCTDPSVSVESLTIASVLQLGGARSESMKPIITNHFESATMPDSAEPYGTHNLNPHVQTRAGPIPHVRCNHRDCGRWLRRPTIAYDGDLCPEHQIRCHYSRNGPTYSYADFRRNFIVGADLVADRIVDHPFKYDTSCLGNEKSEDALTWNVFRSLQEANVLHEVAAWITGVTIPEQPRLYIWGISLNGDLFQPWDLLIAARRRFEQNLPVERPLTEPDIALYLPGRYLILIEAKFTSPNTFYTSGPRRDRRSLTKVELIDIYQDQALGILDVSRAGSSKRVYNQLWRNMVFAERMALQDSSCTLAYLASLTRRGWEQESCENFGQLIRPDFADRFVHRSWEEIDERWAASLPGLSRLHSYFTKKTAALQQAFQLPEEPGG